MVSNDKYFGQVRHWLAVNVSVDRTGKVSVPKDGNIPSYIGPAPLPNYMYAALFLITRRSILSIWHY
jgi:phosphatidylethanolamine-binding protein